MGGRGELFFQKKKNNQKFIVEALFKKREKKKERKKVACAIHSGVTVCKSRRNGTPTALKEQEERNLSAQ